MKCLMIVALIVALTQPGCIFLAGTAIGAAGAGGAYEYQKKQDLKALDQELAEGRITQEEYLQRKKEIEDRSVVY